MSSSASVKSASRPDSFFETPLAEADPAVQGRNKATVTRLGWRPRFPMRAAMLAIILWPAAAVLYAVGATLWLVVPAMLIGGGGIALFDVWWTTALAERIPADKLSRVSSYDWMVSLALLPLGYVLAGPLASALGSVDVLLGGSVLAAIALAFGLLPRQTRTLERFPVRGGDVGRAGRPRASHISGAP